MALAVLVTCFLLLRRDRKGAVEWGRRNGSKPVIAWQFEQKWRHSRRRCHANRAAVPAVRSWTLARARKHRRVTGQLAPRMRGSLWSSTFAVRDRYRREGFGAADACVRSTGRRGSRRGSVKGPIPDTRVPHGAERSHPLRMISMSEGLPVHLSDEQSAWRKKPRHWAVYEQTLRSGQSKRDVRSLTSYAESVRYKRFKQRHPCGRTVRKLLFEGGLAI